MLHIPPSSPAVPAPVHSVLAQGRITALLYAFLAIFWLGLLIGVSFLATPVKFQAPSLTLPVALDVGRATFALLARTEWLLCALLGAGAILAHRTRVVPATGVALLAAILALQALWLLPILDARVAQIMAGAWMPSAGYHRLYVAAEIAKALLLFGLSADALFALGRPAEAARCA